MAEVAPSAKAPVWMSAILWLAAIYNILWGTVAAVLPNQMFEWADMPPLNYPQIWQGLGLLIAVFGVGYAIAAVDPFRFWPIVLMGLLAKLGAAAGMTVAYAQRTLPEKFIFQAIPNDLIWLIPMALVLRGKWRAAHPRAGAATPDAVPGSRPGDGTPTEPRTSYAHADTGEPHRAAELAALSALTRQATLHRGHMLSALTLRELSDKTPTLVVFLRHLGCSFCRETLQSIAAQRKDIESRGVAIVLVHMSQPAAANRLLEKYGLDEPEPVWHISDPDQRLYKVFELQRGTFKQLFGLREFARGFRAAFIKGHLFGLPQGDGRQLGGAFLFYRRHVIQAYRSERASDRVDALAVASCPIDKPPPPPAEPLSRRGSGVTLT